MLVNHLMRILRQLNQQGRTLLLEQQNARKAIGISNRGYVLEKGSVCYTGNQSELENSDEVRERCGL